jgi:hypothetical protein
VFDARDDLRRTPSAVECVDELDERDLAVLRAQKQQRYVLGGVVSHGVKLRDRQVASGKYA